MRRLARLLAGSVLAAGAFNVFATAAHSSCIAPATNVTPHHLRAGSSLSIEGTDWGTECNDVFVCSAGCSGQSCTGGEPSPPVEGITIVLRPLEGTSGDSSVLATGIDADATSLDFTVEVRIPRTISAGRYVIVARSDTTGEIPSRTIRID